MVRRRHRAASAQLFVLVCPSSLHSSSKPMNRKLILVVLLVGFAGSFAIYSNRRTERKQVGDFGRADIEAEIKEALKLKEINLTQEAGDKYVGSGTGNDGKRYEIKVTRSENKLTWESEDDKGAKVIGSKRWSGTRIQ
jgi:hypothetical protein